MQPIEMMEVYSFDKTLQERLTEYTDILSNPGKIVPASQIQSEWACDTEIVIEPVGWDALWNMSRSTCEELEIHYPTIVMVEVISVDCSTLSALVKITYVQDDIHLPEKHCVKLIELYPTIKQKNPSLDILGTANCIERLRFFYNYLWMPWDEDEDEDLDWINQHLEPRLRLVYDMMRGVVNKETCDLVMSLMREGKKIKEKITMLEAALSDEEEIHDGIADETCQLMKFHFRLQQIKSEMEVLESPLMREMLVKNQSLTIEKKRSSADDKNRENTGYFVWLGGTIKELQEVSNKMQTLVPEDLSITVCRCLDEALHISETGDIILLGEGSHPVKGASGLEEGGTIRGIELNPESTVLCPKDTDRASALLDFSGKEVLLENISIDLGELQVGIIVRKGAVRVTNCKIYVSNQSTVKLGVVVMPGAHLVIENTVFEGLGSAVVACATAELEMSECSFKNCIEGIQLSDNSAVTATKCCFENLTKYGIRIETRKYLIGTESKSGDTELLNDVSEVVLKECKFLNNGANVSLKPKGIVALSDGNV